MALSKLYSRINWEDYPSENTAINEENLNRMDDAINELDNRLISQDTQKFDKTSAYTLIKDWTIDEETGIITITKYNGEQIIFDLNLEKIPVSFSLSEDGILTMTTDDGTQFRANIGDMIPVLTFESTDTIAVTVSGTGKDKTYQFEVKDGSITADKLQPDYLAEIRVETAASSKNASDAAAAANTATTAATTATEQAAIATTKAEDAAVSEQNAGASATSAGGSANVASIKASDAGTFATNAAASATAAEQSATSAETSAQTATQKASETSASASTATTKAQEASASATFAQNYATGDVDSAKYYYEQAKQISEGLGGALMPMGTVTFENLPLLVDVGDGWMYNISNEFITTAEFKEGVGNTIPAGVNVYKTADGYWDVFAGNPVTGVKGDKESSYRRGNVNITPENIGALPEDGNAVSATKAEQDGNGNNIADTYLAKTDDSKDNTVSFSQASNRVNIVTGEKHSTIMGKIKKWFADMTAAAFAQVISSNTDLMALTVAGYLPDALAVKQQFDVVNGNLTYKLISSDDIAFNSDNVDIQLAYEENGSVVIIAHIKVGIDGVLTVANINNVNYRPRNAAYGNHSYGSASDANKILAVKVDNNGVVTVWVNNPLTTRAVVYITYPKRHD